jgi:hypothetical protein
VDKQDWPDAGASGSAFGVTHLEPVVPVAACGEHERTRPHTVLRPTAVDGLGEDLVTVLRDAEEVLDDVSVESGLSGSVNWEPRR